MSLVVKLGGSTAGQPQLDVWIDALANSRLPLVIVPGGGPFADAVREAQKRMRFSDGAAHRMAILAMEQFAEILIDRDRRFAAARSLDNIRDLWSMGRPAVWFPSTLAAPASDIPASWDITSDSLAAWLAGKLDARHLLLIKQTSSFSAQDSVQNLAARDIVDPAFLSMLPMNVELRLAGPLDAPKAGALLASGKMPGTRIAAPKPIRKAG